MLVDKNAFLITGRCPDTTALNSPEELGKKSQKLFNLCKG